MDKVEMRAYLGGRVQGVGLRYTALDHAKKLKVVGFVRNLPDGRVEIIAQGSKQTLEQFLELLKTQAGSAKVTEVELDYFPASQAFEKFSIE